MPSFSTLRHYLSGSASGFDDIFSKPSIYDTGKGSRQRHGRTRFESPAPTTYTDIKAQCLADGALWEDPDFPADDSSLYYEKRPNVDGPIVWLRPGEICSDPQMFVDGATRMDINQGRLGDCWMLAALASLATDENLLHRVVPNDQSFEQEDYAGVFRFQFWQYGHWVEVVIDDRLPTVNGALFYMRSDNCNEFWGSLLEKAYAKVNGAYEALAGGWTSEALTDFTGGVVERFTLEDEAQSDLLKCMLRAHALGALFGTSVNSIPDRTDSRLDNGLVMGHAYSITDIRKVEIETPSRSGMIPMVRVRNPWGNKQEWKGAFSDESEEWKHIPEDQREELGLTFSHDGEFWMTFDDYINNFQRLDICYLGPDSFVEGLDEEAEESINKWQGHLLEGNWVRNVSAGGCTNYKSFYTNPQYHIDVPEPDDEDEDEDEDEDGKSCVVIAVMQKGRRKLYKEGQDNHAIGYAVYHLDEPECGTLGYNFFTEEKKVARSPEFSHRREVCNHHNLDPGHYVIVPSTFEPNQETPFILRIFTQKQQRYREIDDNTCTSEPQHDEMCDDDEDSEDKAAAGRQAFIETAGEDGEVDAYELQGILNETFQQEFEFDGFSTDMCRSMVAMKDADLSGRLQMHDFESLWDDLRTCKKAFKTCDIEGNGYFNSYELRLALHLLGMHVSNSTLRAIVMRYSNKEGHVRFDDFVTCVIRLKLLFKFFGDKDEEEAGEAPFKLDEFIQFGMYS